MEKRQSKLAKERDRGLNYGIIDIDRPKEVITIHGKFLIVENKSTTPLCNECWYNKTNEKTGKKRMYEKGAPCNNNKWCGNLHSILKKQ